MRAKHSRFCGFLFVERADWNMVFLEKFVAEVQIYRKTIIIGCFFFFSYIMGKKVKNSKYTNTVYILTLVVMREGVSRDYIYKLIIQNKYRQTRGD